MNNYIKCKLIKDSVNLDDPANGDIYLKMGNDATCVTQQMVDDFIKTCEVSRMGNATVVKVILVNGFEIIGSSACVDPANYNEVIGKYYALEKVKKQIWFLLGFLLACAKNGFRV